MMRNVSDLFVSLDATLRDVLTRSEETRHGIVLIVDSGNRLRGVITDGDIRRAFLARIDLDTPVRAFLEKKSVGAPVTAPIGTQHAELVELLRASGVSHIPLVNVSGQVEKLVGLEDLLQEDEKALQAVVMAGGRGTRLHPLTAELPKPMLPVGDRPLMERIIRRLSDAGVRDVSITTHYRAEKIVEHFGNGKQFGVNLSYVPEEELLGTAGGLALMPPPTSALLVINGDILTEMDFRAMLAFHREHAATLTLAVRQFEFQVPYGVIESDGAFVRQLVEKPAHKFFVNAGIYLLEPAAHGVIPKGRHFDMTDLIKTCLDEGLPVVSFPIWEYWRDIGRHDDYAQAQVDVNNGTVSR